MAAAIASKSEAAEKQQHEHMELKDTLELKKYEAVLADERMKTTSQGALLVKLEKAEKEMEELTRVNAEAQKTHAEANAEVKRMEKEEENFSGSKDGKIKETEKAIEKTTKLVAKLEKEKTKAASVALTAQSDAEAFKDERDSYGEELEAENAKIEPLTKEIEAGKEKLAKAQEALEDEEEKFRICSEALKGFNDRIADLREERAAIELEMTELTLSIKKRENAIEKASKNGKQMAEASKTLEKQNPWINKEKELFNKDGLGFHFDNEDPQEIKDKLQKLVEAQETLSHSINKSVLTTLEHVESEYDALVDKRTALANDRKKIEAAIADIDIRKKETIRTTYEKVNKSFGEIFTTLLPGANSKLTPGESGDVLDGLVVNVGFAGKWKESLTELSGGQRSLLALSLVLSLLLFKPAPFYILDEVDAALDLSHTQNIGTMIRQHFSNAQFVVVSLKEGMFSNANALFRVKFIDGVSTVSRTVGAHGKMNDDDNNVVKTDKVTKKKRN
eukprot:TRINITY_DN33662_c0_g1_i1.p1 TRINITY_DN33662_c0_g1~~TRINITY_DN33662_c0_g1_i1.p1  ORF type:complete len:548 (+),score=210.52 TRINITY_DN33662_c0_g1_i1:130-1644(+)